VVLDGELVAGAGTAADFYGLLPRIAGRRWHLLTHEPPLEAYDLIASIFDPLPAVTARTKTPQPLGTERFTQRPVPRVVERYRPRLGRGRSTQIGPPSASDSKCPVCPDCEGLFLDPSRNADYERPFGGRAEPVDATGVATGRSTVGPGRGA
jgi:hypothetical protein